MNSTRRYRPVLEGLEPRELLAVVAAPLARPDAVGPVNVVQMRHAYSLDQLFHGAAAYNAHAGAGQVVAIVDAYHDPGLRAEVTTFSANAHLPPVHLTEALPQGDPGPDPAGQWNYETALDVEWVHALVPAARILLVDALGASAPAMLSAETYALAHASIVTDSWGSPAFAGDSLYDSYFQPPAGRRAVVTISAGDVHGQLNWPADTPSGLSIGGTTLNVSASGIYLGERLWTGSGPRGVVGFDADPASGVPVDVDGKWWQIGGTSLSSPCWAAVVALTDQVRQAHRLPVLGTPDVQVALRHLPSRDFHTGHGIPGRGSPVAARLVPALAAAPAQKLEIQETVPAAPPPITLTPDFVLRGHHAPRLRHHAGIVVAPLV